MANKKNEDCYFYYYSTCMKADNCPYRHEPSALGKEQVCPDWSAGNCMNQPCPFRHMLPKKNRKDMQCYFETQPGGCRKPHCVFKHLNPRADVVDLYQKSFTQPAEVVNNSRVVVAAMNHVVPAMNQPAGVGSHIIIQQQQHFRNPYTLN